MTRATKRLRRSGLAGLAAVATVGGALVVTAGSAGATSTATVTRIAGTDRYDTAAQLAAKAFAGGATNVVLASGAAAHFPDALAGNYLAGQLNAPILLTSSTGAIPTSTMTEITALKPTNVYILGDVNAVPAAQETALTAAGYKVTRLGGVDRYATAKLVAEQPGLTAAGTVGGVKTAIVVDGQNFPDALSAGPLAFADKLPVVITTPTTLSPTALSTLTDLGIKQVIIAGGLPSVSAADEASINTAGITTLKRFAGTDRSNTSQLLAEWELANGFVNTSFTVATGDQSLNGADALAAGPFAGLSKTPVLVTDTITNGGSVDAFATAHAATETSVNVLGKAASVSDAIVAALTTAVQTIPSTQSLTVAPAAAAIATQGGNTQFSVTGLDNATTYTLELFQCSNVTTKNGATTFTQTTPPSSSNNNTGSGIAAQGTVADNKFSVVNGAATSGTPTSTTVTPVNGTVSFTVANSASGANTECVVPVVYVDTDKSGTLNTNTSTGAPTETFGVGGGISFVPAEATFGAHNGVTVTDAEPSSGYFVAGGLTFKFDSNDVFQYQGVGITMANFAAALSTGDVLTVAYNNSAAGVSTFNITTDFVPPATAVTATAGGSTGKDVTVSWTASTQSGVTYDVWRSTDNTLDTAADTKVGSALTGTTYTDSNVANGTYYYFVVAHSTATSAAAASAISAQVTVPLAADTTPPTLVESLVSTDSGFGGVADAGDVWKLDASEAVTATSGAGLILTDAGGTNQVTVTNGQNATFSVSGTILTITLTKTLTYGTNNTAIDYPLTITNSSGIADTAGNRLTVGSGDVTVDTSSTLTATTTVGAAGATTFTVTFNHPVDPATVSTSDFTCTPGGVGGANGACTISSVSLGTNNTVATVTVSRALATGDVVGISANSVKDVTDALTGPASAASATVA